MLRHQCVNVCTAARCTYDVSALPACDTVCVSDFPGSRSVVSTLAEKKSNPHNVDLRERHGNSVGIVVTWLRSSR